MPREEGAGLWVPGWEGCFGAVQRNQNGSGGMALLSAWGCPQVLCQAVSPGEVTVAPPLPSALCELLN